MAHALLARNNQDGRRCLSLSLPYDDDDDTRGFRELLDVIDSSRSANANDSGAPLLKEKPMESCSSTPIQVEEHQRYNPPGSTTD